MATSQEHSEKLVQAQIDISVLKTQFEHQARAMQDLKDGQAALAAQLQSIQDTLSRARGGWKVLMLIGGASAGLGGAISYFLQHFHWRG